ncbi:MAG: succinate--CoA ligase subunit beta [Spirulinaceae cyanobacterium SM2_1_0]|nr:succinate--CoA ligase subunit beta [Spirulinaceae cyanobacterium SM2_1_0]
MDLLEYQAKALFREVGIPVLPSQCIDASRAIKQLRIPYPIVLKSQVRAAGRGKAGGVRFVENTIDGIAAAQSILDLPISGEYPQVLLAEARYDAQQEIFLAIAIDYQRRCPVLLGSASGGVDTACRQEALQTVAITGEFSPFYGRRLALQMGLDSALVPAIGSIVEKMYRLFISRELNSIEINPLGISANGEVMALDGKIAANDGALGRHPDLQALLQSLPIDRESPNGHQPLVGHSPVTQWFEWGQNQGEIAIVTNRRGLGMATWDLLCQQQGEPLGCLVVDLTTPTQANALAQALEQLTTSGVRAIAINLLADPPQLRAAAEAIAHYVQHRATPPTTPGGEDRVNRPTALTMRALRQRPRRSSPHTVTQPTHPTLFLRLGAAAIATALQADFAHLPVRWAAHSEALAAAAVSLTAQAVRA